MTGGTIATTGVGANGAFATGSGSTLALDGGTIIVTGGTYTASSKDSPALYSTGVLTVTGATLTATGAKAAVIEGSNSITLADSTLSTTFGGKRGVMIYQSMSGDSTGTITIKGVTVSEASGVLLSAAAGSWGTSGSNGGNATLAADGETLTGNVTADSVSTATIKLTNGSSLSGMLTNASISLDATSSWSVTGNGHTVTYDATNSASSAHSGGTYTLAGGGRLKPAS